MNTKLYNLLLVVFLCILTAVTYCYMRYVEPQWIEVDAHSIVLPLGSLQKNEVIRILHLSDLHLSDNVPIDYLRRVVDQALAKNPDIIVLTGDFITGKIYWKQEYVALLKKLSNHAPSFACFGNHDGGRWAGQRGGYFNTLEVQRLLEESGIVPLKNQYQRIVLKGVAFDIIGLGDLWAEDCFADKVFRQLQKDPNVTRIILAHNPDTKKMIEHYRWELMLSGHSHGGQLKIPIIGYPFAPVSDVRFVEGLKVWQGHYIYVTRGVGNLYGLRLNSRPQISFIEIEKGSE